MDFVTYLETTVRRGYVPDFQGEIDEVADCSTCDYNEFCTDSMKRNCELNERGEI
jgi:hypothetical protein